MWLIDANSLSYPQPLRMQDIEAIRGIYHALATDIAEANDRANSIDFEASVEHPDETKDARLREWVAETIRTIRIALTNIGTRTIMIEMTPNDAVTCSKRHLTNRPI